MTRCLELAQRAKGYTAPNPMVGAVLVHNGRVLAEGWHRHYGGEHAEVNCLNKVAARDKHLLNDSTLYVNLEPCTHYGNTPPCATRIIADGVGRVVVANQDPFDMVSGKGITMLRDAGIAVETGIMEAEGRWVNRRFFCYHSQKRPYVILKFAQTKDGYIAPSNRERFHITNDLSARMLHKWRTEESAIMVGTHTALYDNPLLTSRLLEGKQPLRIVIDRTLQVPTKYNLFNADAPTWVLNSEKDALSGNIHFIQLDFEKDILPQLMDLLHTNRIVSLIVEGGAKLLQSFIDMGLWDEARIFTGNTILGAGVAAPLLTGSTLAMDIPVADDQLSVFVNKKSQYPYADHMEL